VNCGFFPEKHEVEMLMANCGKGFCFFSPVLCLCPAAEIAISLPLSVTITLRAAVLDPIHTDDDNNALSFFSS